MAELRAEVARRREKLMRAFVGTRQARREKVLRRKARAMTLLGELTMQLHQKEAALGRMQ